MADQTPDPREPTERKDNVVSLDRLREQRRRAAPDAAAGALEPTIAGPPADADAKAAVAVEGTGEAASAEAGGAPAAPPLERQPGKLIWLHCPACGTLEYTELAIPGGRRHKCGAMVEEAAVEIDLRAEMTLAEINLQRIAALGQYLEQQRQRFQEYQQRLALIAGERPLPYPLSEAVIKALPVAEVDPVGLIVSEALHNPAKRFEKKKE